MEENEHNEPFLSLTESLQVPKWECKAAPELFVQILRNKSIFYILAHSEY